jgi:hypothetical protein
MNSKAIKPEKEKLKFLFGFLVSKFNHALSAARRSAGSAARYWATMEAAMLATIPGSERQKEELRFKKSHSSRRCSASLHADAGLRPWSIL